MTKHLSPVQFKAAMALFASGVVVVTTRDEDGTPKGFTASSFCSVSVDPPLVLVCLARSAGSHAAFVRSERFAVSVLQGHHERIARRFASAGTDKFVPEGLSHTPAKLPAVAGAMCVLECTVHDRHTAGDHTILVGRVDAAMLAGGQPMIYFDREFHRLGVGHRAA
jgi:flavin reductase ActVB